MQYKFLDLEYVLLNHLQDFRTKVVQFDSGCPNWFDPALMLLSTEVLLNHNQSVCYMRNIHHTTSYLFKDILSVQDYNFK